MGCWRSGQDQTAMETLLCEHAGVLLTLSLPRPTELVRLFGSVVMADCFAVVQELVGIVEILLNEQVWLSLFPRFFVSPSSFPLSHYLSISPLSLTSVSCSCSPFLPICLNQGLIFVVDSNDRERIQEAKDELDRMVGQDASWSQM